MSHSQGTIRERLEGRKEPRVLVRIEVHIRKADGSNLGEILFTENVSGEGAGFFSSSFWKPDDEVLLKSLRLGVSIQGKIQYCKRVGEHRFAVGVKVFSGKGNWAS